MAEFGTPFGVDEYLRLGGIAQGYTNERMGRANALRSLTGLSSVSGPQTGIDASLRSISTATHKDIAARLTDRMLGQRLDNEDQFRGRWDRLFGENYNEFYNEVIKNWREQVRLGISQASEKRAIALAPGVKTRQEQTIEKEKARIKAVDIDVAMIAVIKRAAEDDIQAIIDGEKYHAVVRDRLTNESAGWEKNHSDYYKSLMEMAGQKPDPAEITRIAKLALDDATQYVIDTTISGVESGMSASGAYSNAVLAVRSGAVSGKYDDQEAVRRLKALGYNVVPLTKKEKVAAEQAALTLRKGLATEDIDIQKAQVAFDKAEIDLREARELSTTKVAKAKAELRKAQGLDYKEALVRMNKVADDFEGENNPDRYPVAEEQVDQALRGLNLDGSQVANIQSALARRLHHLAAPDIPAGAKAFIWAYKAADPTGKTDAEHRKELVVLREFLKKHYRVDYEMLGMMGPGSWYAENINQIVDSAIEALSPDAELKPIRELKGTGKRGKDGVIDRKLVNRLPTEDEMESFVNRGIIYIITINGAKKKIILQDN